VGEEGTIVLNVTASQRSPRKQQPHPTNNFLREHTCWRGDQFFKLVNKAIAEHKKSMGL
jgi:hypothetical protein